MTTLLPDRSSPATRIHPMPPRRRVDHHALAGGETGSGPSRTHRVVLMASTIGLFGPMLAAWQSIVQIPAVGAICATGCAVALALAVLTATARTERALRRLDGAVLLTGLVVLGAWAATSIYLQPSYGTDEAAFVQYAAQLLLHGHDPYKANLLPALTRFRVPITFATYRLDGTISSTLAYPALSFLFVLPLQLLTHGVQSVIVANAVALIAETVLVFCFLPRRYRALSVVVTLGLQFLFANTIGGVIVTLAVPLMLVVAYRWTDIGRGGHLGRGGVLRAVCLGLAMSTTQFPWFVAPFLLIGLWHLRAGELGRRRAAAVAARFAGMAAVTALAVNAPFIAWGPSAWALGILTPLLQHAIPFGQGLIDATTRFHLGGGDLAYYTLATVAAYLALLVVYAQRMRALLRATFVLPSIVFLFSTRSLSEYFMMMVGVWMVALVNPGEGAAHFAAAAVHGHGGPRRWWRAVAIAVPAAATLGAIVLALASPPPLDLHVESMRTNGQFQSIWQMRVRVTNRSHHTLRPHFATDASGYMTTFWNVASGPRRLSAGGSATYVLVAPNVGSMPGVTQPFVLQGVTASPETISTSSLMVPERFTTTIAPSYVDRFVPLGHSVTLGVSLRSPYGARVDQAGVRIALGQVIYAQNGLVPGEASIDGAPEGRSPVVAVTNAAGTARFRITDRSWQGGDPLYFQAYVDPAGSFPYGYSEVVSVKWVHSGTLATGGRAPGRDAGGAGRAPGRGAGAEG